jgi:hypothetical protein
MVTSYKTPEEIEASIASDYAREIAACEGLADAYFQRCEPRWSGRSAEGLADRIFLLEVGRQTKTFRASIDLARRGYAEQASMLNRALFESMLVARWINVNGSTAADRFDRALRFEEHLKVERLNNTGWLEEEGKENLESPLDASELPELAAEFGQYGDRMWTGHQDIRDLLSSIKDQFEERELKLIENYLRLGHQENNQLLHSTVAGLSQVFTSAPGDLFAVWTGPSDALVGKALFYAYSIYGQTLEITVERFELNDSEGLDSQLTEASYVFKTLPAGVPAPGRNDPCFCGSGKKYKKCHGA